ncbi:DUF3613 domain-containing protein [Herminiimonas sp. KBW02]|uniref:DUF3613 domain-containing protein n=1 Tax=Herminiimonas sp. KBW02 TaxID=2153363 RepID=UPI000F5AC13F|nr:DUF3613 domain-containing protein [Herminiimonas sp. KBW02]RQO34667.1 DUF3613 domain-containing protein [Herminiimonas sp. KBW02]
MKQPFLKQAPVTRCIALTVFVSVNLGSLCHAQNPVVSQEPVIQERVASRQIGDATSSLLQMQVSGSMAGPALPMLGATSSLSWERYKDSFKHKIPESFERAVSKSNTGGQ